MLYRLMRALYLFPPHIAKLLLHRTPRNGPLLYDLNSGPYEIKAYISSSIAAHFLQV